MIANAGGMGLDWRFLSLSAYLEALEAHNGMTNPAPAEASDGLKRFIRAHRDGGNRQGGASVASPSESGASGA